MGDLVKYANKFCPKGVSHSHDRGTKLKNNKITCFLCNPYGDSIAINFSKYCCKNTNTYKLDKNQKCALFLGFNYLRNKYNINVPVEIFLIINDIYKSLTKPLKIDSHSIKHMMNCYKCSNEFMLMIDEHSCNRHMLPRITRNSRFDDI